MNTCLAEQLIGLNVVTARGAAEEVGATYDPATDSYLFADGSRVKFTPEETINLHETVWCAPAGFTVMRPPECGGFAVIAKDAGTGFRTVRVDLDAAQWELIADVTEIDEDDREGAPEWSEESEAFAGKINDTINTAISAGCTRQEIEASALALMSSDEGADYGANDPDTQEVLSLVLDDVYAALATINRPTPPEHQS